MIDNQRERERKEAVRLKLIEYHLVLIKKLEKLQAEHEWVQKELVALEKQLFNQEVKSAEGDQDCEACQ